MQNVKDHSPLPAGASVGHGVEVKTAEDHGKRAADRGCCVSASSAEYYVAYVVQYSSGIRANLPHFDFKLSDRVVNKPSRKY